jgi:hypothetical protein
MFAGEDLLHVWTKVKKRGIEIQAKYAKPNDAIWEGRIKGRATGFANSPFMLRSTREKRKDIKRIAHKFNVNGDCIHKMRD